MLASKAPCTPLTIQYRHKTLNHRVYTAKSVALVGTVQDRRHVKLSVKAQAAGPVQGTGLSPELKAAIDQFITENKVVVFMKGTKQMPLCGFSNTVVQILNTMNAPFIAVNILEDELLRTGMKDYSAWPTFPQVYIDGEFFGGCDIMIASYQNGELQEVLEAALNS